MSFINIGVEKVYYGITRERIVGIFSFRGLPMKRLRDSKKASKQTIDLTAGAKLRSLILLDTGELLLSAHSAKLILEKLNRSPVEVLSGVVRRGRFKSDEGVKNEDGSM